MNYTVCGRQLLFVEDDEKIKKELLVEIKEIALYYGITSGS